MLAIRDIWAIWYRMWVSINSHATAWVGYALIVLGVAFDQWPTFGNLIPENRRGIAYSVIGAIVLGFRARNDIAGALSRYRELRAREVPK